jgi:hypothetical protein
MFEDDVHLVHSLADHCLLAARGSGWLVGVFHTALAWLGLLGVLGRMRQWHEQAAPRNVVWLNGLM